MIVVRRQVRRPMLPQPMRGTCDKPCRFVGLCGKQNLEVFRHLPKRAGRLAHRQSGYTLIEHVVWNTNPVQAGSATARLNTLGMFLPYPRESLAQPMRLEGNHGIRSRCTSGGTLVMPVAVNALRNTAAGADLRKMRSTSSIRSSTSG